MAKLRDRFAMQLIGGMVTVPGSLSTNLYSDGDKFNKAAKELHDRAYKIADAIVAERKRLKELEESSGE